MNFGGRFLFCVCCVWVYCASFSVLPLYGQSVSIHNQKSVLGRGPIGYLGVGVIAVDAEIAKALGLKEERGVQITEVANDSPASRGGLKERDVVLDYNGQTVEGTAQFQRMVAETPANRTVNLGVFRNGAKRTLSVLVGRHEPDTITFSFDMPVIPMAPIPPPPPPEMPDIPAGLLSWQSSTLGYVGEPIDGQFADFFGVKEGVLIRSVTKASPAEKAGLKAGDVVVKVDTTPVRSPREITAVAHRRRQRKSLSFTVIRSHREMTLELIARNRDLEAPCFPAV